MSQLSAPSTSRFSHLATAGSRSKDVPPTTYLLKIAFTTSPGVPEITKASVRTVLTATLPPMTLRSPCVTAMSHPTSCFSRSFPRSEPETRTLRSGAPSLLMLIVLATRSTSPRITGTSPRPSPASSSIRHMSFGARISSILFPVFLSGWNVKLICHRPAPRSYSFVTLIAMALPDRSLAASFA